MNNCKDVIFGGLKPCGIESCGETYWVDANIYSKALINSPSSLEGIGHSINLKLDGVEYRYAHLVIGFINHAVLCGKVLVPQEYSALTLQQLDDLPAHLAVVDWCEAMIHSSETFESYREAVKDGIKKMVMLARAVVTHDDSSVGGAYSRIKLLKETGLPIEVPEFLRDIFVLPKAKPITGLDHMVCTLIKNKDKELSVGLYGALEVGGEKLFDYSDKYTQTGKDILALQTQVSNHIYSLQAALIYKEHPEFLRVPGFGLECEAIVRRLMTPEELSICHPTKPADICHVFAHGLTDAVNADYE